MLQGIFALKFLDIIVRPLMALLVLLGLATLSTSHAMEENRETNSPKNLRNTMVSKKKNEVSNPQKQVYGLSINNETDVVNNEEFFLPFEVLFKILPYFDGIPLIQADAVCWFFKVEGDRIWETKQLDLSRRLETPGQKGFNRVKTFAALERGRYKNVRLQYCGLGDMDESSSLMNCKTLDLSHNYIKEISTVCSPEAWKHLQELNLSHNSLKGVEKFFKNLSAPALKKLNLSYNYFTEETVNQLKEAYKHFEILILEPQKEIELRYGGAFGGRHFGDWYYPNKPLDIRGTRY